MTSQYYYMLYDKNLDYEICNLLNKNDKIYFNQLLDHLFPKKLNPKTGEYVRHKQEVLRQHLKILLREGIIEYEKPEIEIGKKRYYKLSKGIRHKIKNDLSIGVESKRDLKKKFNIKTMDEKQKKLIAYRLLISCLHLGSTRVFEYKESTKNKSIDGINDEDIGPEIANITELKSIEGYHVKGLDGFCIEDLYNNNRLSLGYSKRRFGYIIAYFNKNQLRELIQVLVDESPNSVIQKITNKRNNGEDCYQLNQYHSSNEDKDNDRKLDGDNLRMFVLECENLFDWIIDRIKINYIYKGIYNKKKLPLSETKWLIEIFGDVGFNKFFEEIENMKKYRINFYKDFIKEQSPDIQKTISLEQVVHESFQYQIEKCDIYIENAVKRIENMQKTKNKYTDFYEFLFNESYPKFIRKLYN